jgi:importin subunit beta-1
LYLFADQSITYILPSIFTLLIKNKDEEYEQDIDDDYSNISKSASNCLSLFASCSKELVVPQTIEFISYNLLVANSSLVWNQKEAAIIAFGSMMEGPCKYKTQPLVNQVQYINSYPQ